MFLCRTTSREATQSGAKDTDWNMLNLLQRFPLILLLILISDCLSSYINQLEQYQRETSESYIAYSRHNSDIVSFSV